MKTIKQIAQDCGVSEQSIRRWCERNHVAKAAKQWKPNESQVAEIYAYYESEVSQVAKPTKPTKPDCETYETKNSEVYTEIESEVSQVAKPTKPTKPTKPDCETYETTKTVPIEVYESLVEQLAVKDEQIAALNQALLNAQEVAKAAQVLHGAEKQEALLTEPVEVKTEKSKSFWRRLFG